MPGVPEPFTLNVSDSALADLKDRLSRTRFPDEPPGIKPWKTGTSLAYLKELVVYWRETFDWRAWEARLNSFRQYKVRIRDLDLHFIHQPGTGKNPMPLLLSHGWPGSVFEFYKVIPLLAERFTVIAPSLPGFGLSFAPGQRRLGVEEMADVFAELMSILGYERFGAQGGDWGGFITARLGLIYPERLIGIHMNLLPLRRELKNPSTEEEASYEKQLKHWLKEESGYLYIQGTKPQTLAYGLTDSPAGLLGWIGEKFPGWSDSQGNPERAIKRDELLANVSLYWFTGAIGSSFWPYYARLHADEWPIPAGRTVDVPAGYIEFPKEILRPPRSLAEKVFTDLRQWTAVQQGGHFAALEHPEVLANDVKSFFGRLAPE
jgi:microsomal epoxide hydrolase